MTWQHLNHRRCGFVSAAVVDFCTCVIRIYTPEPDIDSDLRGVDPVYSNSIRVCSICLHKECDCRKDCRRRFGAPIRLLLCITAMTGFNREFVVLASLAFADAFDSETRAVHTACFCPLAAACDST